MTEAHDEIADLKGKLRVLSHQFDQLKEEIEAKEASLVKENQEQLRLVKEKDDLATQVEKVRLNAKEMANSKAETERSHLMLRDRLKQVDDELTKIKTQLEKVLRERYLHIFQMTAHGLLLFSISRTLFKNFVKKLVKSHHFYQ